MTQPTTDTERFWHVEAINQETNKTESFDLIAEDAAEAHAKVAERGLVLISVDEIERPRPVSAILSYQRPIVRLPNQRILQILSILLTILGTICVLAGAVGIFMAIASNPWMLIYVLWTITLGAVAFGVAAICSAMGEA